MCKDVSSKLPLQSCLFGAALVKLPLQSSGTAFRCELVPILVHVTFDFIVNQMARWCPACRFNELLKAHPDFPDLYPERGLKVLSFTYEG